MKKTKKILALFLSVLLAFPVMSGMSITSFAELTAQTEGYLTYLIINGEAGITDCDQSVSGELVIPDTLGGCTVASIDEYAFGGCKSLTSITIPDSVSFIGYKAFYDCISLTSIIIPDSVTNIREGAFFGCESLTSITVASGNEYYKLIDGVLYNKEATELICCPGRKTSITIPDSVTSIGEYAFSDCTSLTNVTIPNSVTSIGDWAFSGCTSLTSITIPDSVTSIGEYAFSDCTSLTNVTIPNSVTSIEDWAFSGCTSLTSITIPDSVTEIGNLAFDDCESLTSITVASGNEKYKSIDGVLYNKEVTELIRCPGGKTSITIPDSVTEIGDGAFEDCASLTSITVASGNEKYKSIDGVLYNKEATELILCPRRKTSITIPNSATSIGEYAFDDCTSLTSIIIPNSVTSIGEYAFSDCTSLRNIIIPDSVTEIGNGTFVECKSLTSITIPNSVTSIGSIAFFGCTSLTSITIPESVTKIGDWAFIDCTSLSSVTIPESVTSIGNHAFGYCVGVTMGMRQEYIKVEGFKIYGISGSAAETYAKDNGFTFSKMISEYLTYVIIYGDEAEITDCDESVSGDVAIPDTLGGYPVTSIGYDAFRGCKSLTNITIPNSVRDIRDYAFDGCTSLTSITIPDRVSSIGDRAFCDCTSLTGITIPNSVSSIGDRAFYGCESLTSVTISDSVTEIGENAFGYYYDEDTFEDKKVEDFKINGFYGSAAETYATDNGFTFAALSIIYEIVNEEAKIIRCDGTISGDFTIPSAFDGYPVTSIGYCAFSECESLTSITIPDSVTEIEDGAFAGCLALTSITIPNGVTSIGVSAFSGCESLTSITIPDSVTSIGASAFSGCESLTSITIPDSVTELGDGAFGGCLALTSITIPNGVTSIGVSAFASCYALKSITIPDSVTSIGDCAFTACLALTNITIPNGVTSIGDGAFAECIALKNVSIPDSVTSIGAGAFAYCYLENVIIPSSVEYIGEDAFTAFTYDLETEEEIPIENFTIYGYRNTAAEAYANQFGLKFTALDVETCKHININTVNEKEATCTAAGYTGDKVCADCGETVEAGAELPATGHSFPDEWTVTKEASYFADGEEIRVCLNGCGETQTRTVSALTPEITVNNEQGDASISYGENVFDGDVKVNATETTDGEAFNLINEVKGNYKSTLYDITITDVDGAKVQPNGKVLVKIRMPEGYNPKKTVVYYVSDDGTLVNMDARYENGYMCFETDHFSPYAIVDETEAEENCTHICHSENKFVAFFYRIFRFFWKLFGMNHYCKCGAAHW